jgi:hypothetical protein
MVTKGSVPTVARPQLKSVGDNRVPEIVERGVGDENGVQEKPEHPAIGANESYQPGRLALRVKEFDDERRGQTQKNRHHRQGTKRLSRSPGTNLAADAIDRGGFTHRAHDSDGISLAR